MKTLLAIVMAAGLTLMPLAAAAVAAPGSSGSKPPIEQPLVREGDFAVELANSLNITTSNDETEAESSLAAMGIAPRNGWVADYPVTPDIYSEVRQSAIAAAGAGKLAMSEDRVGTVITDVSTGLGLSIMVAGDQYDYASNAVPPASYGDYGAQSPEYAYDPGVDDYYADYGPPIVTYYAPPWDYWYLYSWVPWPFWWGGSSFDGFFVLNDFNRTVFHHRGGHGHWGNHHGRSSTVVAGRVTNQVRNPSGRMARIDPVTRASGSAGLGTVANGRAGNRLAGNSQAARSILNNSLSGSRSTGTVSHDADRFSTARPGSRGGLNASRNSSGFVSVGPGRGGSTNSLAIGPGAFGNHSRSQSSGTFSAPATRGFSSSAPRSFSGFSGGGFAAGSSGFGGGGISRGGFSGGFSGGHGGGGFGGVHGGGGGFGGGHGGGFSGGHGGGGFGGGGGHGGGRR